MFFMMSMKGSTILWIFFFVVLSLFTFGLSNILFILLCIFSFVIGVFGVLWDIADKKVDKEIKTYEVDEPFKSRLGTGLKWLMYEAENSKKLPKFDRRLSGSTEIDNVLHDVLEYLVRDYIKDWYDELTDNQEFYHHIQSCLHELIRAFASRCKSIDWQNHLTSSVVEGLTSHIRLFRKSQEKVTKLVSQSKDSLDVAYDNVSINSQKSFTDSDKQSKTLKDVFFEYECSSSGISREHVSSDPEVQKLYFKDVCEVLMYLLLPKDEFLSQPIKLIAREILVNAVFMPTIKLFSDPDYLNQYVHWLINDNCMTSDCFLNVIRSTSFVDELSAVREKADEEFEKLRSKDTVGDDFSVKQQLSSIRYVKVLCDKRLRIHRESGNQIDFQVSDLDLEGYNVQDKSKLYSLPFQTLLHNNIALQAFIEFMQSVNRQEYLLFWLTIEGYRTSALQYIESENQSQGASRLEMIRDIAKSIYNQYLSPQANPRVPIESSIDKQLYKKLTTGEPSPYIFDDIQTKVYLSMLREDQFYPAFKQTKSYLKLLAELDLLKESSINSDTCNNDNIEETQNKNSNDSTSLSSDYKIFAEITQTGICTEHGKNYALYAISVTIKSADSCKKWDTFRRYREFNDLHLSLRENGCNMDGLVFPKKTLFKMLKVEFLEKRKEDLNIYLDSLLKMLNSNENVSSKVYEVVTTFLNEKAYQKTNRNFATKMDNIVKQSMKNVSTFINQAPDSFMDGIIRASDKVHDHLKETWQDMLPGNQANNGHEDDVVAAVNLNKIEGNNVWLGVGILLLDEVFDLKERNQWLRRHVLHAIQQFVRTLFGDRMNKKIDELIQQALSASAIAGYIGKFRNSMWPGGILADTKPERDNNTIMRTRVLAKTKLMGCVPDELKTIVGNETCKRAMLRLFEMMQNSSVNARLIFVLLEGALHRLFPCNNFEEMKKKFHDPVYQSKLGKKIS